MHQKFLIAFSIDQLIKDCQLFQCSTHQYCNDCINSLLRIFMNYTFYIGEWFFSVIDLTIKDVCYSPIISC